MKKNKYCVGCGVVLQDENITKLGFTTDIKNDLCMRCFRFNHYGEYESVSESLVDYQNILGEIGKTKDLVLYVVDILNVPRELETIKKYLNNDVILVLNKRDLLPLSVKDEKIITYFLSKDLGFLDIVTVSSEKNYHMDLLYKLVNKYKKTKHVYIVGYTNAGKSCLITKFVKNYGDGDVSLTVAPIPSTTLNKVYIPINDRLTFIDTPGIIDNSNLINYVDTKFYKKLNSKKEIKPRTYQLMKKQSLLINDLIRIDYLEGDRNSFTFYIPNEIKMRRCTYHGNTLKSMHNRIIEIKFGEDLVINGLGFIKIVCACKINIYINKDIEVFTRKSII